MHLGKKTKYSLVLTLLHSKRPKLHRVLAILSATGLKGNNQELMQSNFTFAPCFKTGNSHMMQQHTQQDNTSGHKRNSLAHPKQAATSPAQTKHIHMKHTQHPLLPIPHYPTKKLSSIWLNDFVEDGFC